MCGFVGYFDKGGQAAQEKIVNQMISKIRYRGPDDQGAWVHGPVGLGHCRLSILDLSERGHQPFVTEDGMGVLTYNGEVYNFQYLRKQLEAEGIRFRSNTDTEVVLNALHYWGPAKAIPLFNGMFAFAYFDKRDNSIWIARDRTGIKPAYIARKGNLVAFASEMKALFEHPGVPCEPDVHVLGHFLTFQRFEGDWTPFKYVEQISAGSYVRIDSMSEERTVYFDLLRDVNVDRILENMKRSPEDLTREFEEAISKSVEMHLISDAPLATMCSGGIDSSLTTAIAREYKEDVVAYVANVVGPISEGAKAEMVGRHINAKVRRIDVSADSLLRLWPLTVWHGDQPQCHANDMPYMMVTRACREDGIKAVLTGEGSDELFGGYRWQAQVHKMWELRRKHAAIIKNNGLFKAFGKLHPMLKPMNIEQLKKYPFQRREEMEFHQDRLRTMAIADGGRRLKRQRELFEKLEKVEPIEDRAFLARTFEDWYGNLQAVLHRNDRISMAASIESRPPFLENRMIDIGMHFPAWVKYRNKSCKWIVKQVGDKKLPRDIVHSEKLHFPVAMSPFQKASGLIRGGLLPDLFKWSKAETDEMINQSRAASQVIYNMLSVEVWARLFLKGQSAENVSEELIKVQEDYPEVSSMSKNFERIRKNSEKFVQEMK